VYSHAASFPSLVMRNDFFAHSAGTFQNSCTAAATVTRCAISYTTIFISLITVLQLKREFL